MSYAYGTATALTSYILLTSSVGAATTSILPRCHAGALMFYGIRLCLFLLYRELCTQRMKASVRRIEATAPSSRLARTPFILSCAVLYFGLCAPLLLTCHLDATTTMSCWQQQRWLLGGVGCMWGGFGLAAWGDLTKSWVKSRRGEDHLVTGGIYALCRHPNYSGEFLAWTANGLVGVVAAALLLQQRVLPTWQVGFYAVASVMGAIGLDFIVLAATAGLEKRQQTTYGTLERYHQWIRSTWCGFRLPGSPSSGAPTTESE